MRAMGLWAAGAFFRRRELTDAARRFLERAHLAGATRQKRFAQWVDNSRIERVGDRIPSHGAVVRPARVGGKKIILRYKPDPAAAEAALRHHHAFLLVAHQMGCGQLVLPAAALHAEDPVRGFPRGSLLMATEHAGDRFRRADGVAEAVRPRVSREERLGAAALGALFINKDQIESNVLLSDSGELRLVDLDNTLGIPESWPGWKSLFFPGRPLAFDEGRSRRGGSPAEIREAISHLSSLSPGDIASMYGLGSAGAAILSRNAATLLRCGLRAGIERVKWWSDERPFP